MKTIMFNNKYGMTQAVLDRIKTMTRRIIKDQDYIYKLYSKGDVGVLEEFLRTEISPYETGGYKVGEVVAIAQSYKDAGIKEVVGFVDEGQNQYTPIYANESAGWNNKMFVKADLMPNLIEMVDVKIELLQDISDEDCLKEGVEKWMDCYIVSGIMENHGRNNACFDTPREAFAALFDKISGKGTWEKNPFVLAYTFELI